MPEPLSAAPVRPRRRPRWLLALPLVVFAVPAYHFVAGYAADRELAAAVAQADSDDPDWRVEQIRVKRSTYAPEDNAAETVLAAQHLLPPDWSSPADPAGRLEARVRIPPQLALTDPLVRDLRTELAREGVRDALAATERLSRQRGGRYEIAVGENPLVAAQPYQHARSIIRLLRMRSLLYDTDGQADEALATARRILVAGRSIGDEPSLQAHLVRLTAQLAAAHVVERALAQGLPSAEALARTQGLVAEVAAEPLMLYAFRGERACQHQFAEAVEAGELAMDGSPARGWRERVDYMYIAPMARRYHATLLRALNEAVAIARREAEEQGDLMQRLAADLRERGRQSEGHGEALTGALLRSLENFAASFRRDRAHLRNALVGLALERYRLAQGRWPDHLRELAPDYLPAVPIDPFDGRELRYKRLPDGVLIYSVGPDKQDNDGALDRSNFLAPGTDLGFRLWDVPSRRQPAAELLPLPDDGASPFSPRRHQGAGKS
jgi:hypothetical protein